MRKLDGLSLLWISVSCCIFVSLGYVFLFQNLSNKVSDPNTPEFWQLRDVALEWRDPAQEAQEAFSRGDLASFDPELLIDSSAHRVFNHAIDQQVTRQPATVQASMYPGFAINVSDEADRLARSYQKYVDSSAEFAMAYNRELIRLINRR